MFIFKYFSKNSKKYITLRSFAASSKGHTLWPWCFLDVWQTQQRTSSSDWQNNLRPSPWVAHRASGLDTPLPEYKPALADAFPFCSCAMASHTFFRARLMVGSVREHFLLHTGHSLLAAFLFQKPWRQRRQKLWLHFRTTGSVKISQQTGQESSSSIGDCVWDDTALGRRTGMFLRLGKVFALPGWEEALGRKGMAAWCCWSGVRSLLKPKTWWAQAEPGVFRSQVLHKHPHVSKTSPSFGNNDLL